MNIWQTVVDMVVDQAPHPDLFNPYRDLHAAWDLPDAPAIRIQNLKNYLDDHAESVDILLVAEAPGPWGCRFSGVPVTSEAQLIDPEFPARGNRSTLRDEAFSEYTASIYWRELAPFYDRILTWNTVPMHPFHSGKIDSIRTPRQSEIDMFLPLLCEVVDRATPRRVLAVGRKAESALMRISVDADYVRHPSQGGASLFRAGVASVLSEMGIRPRSGHELPTNEMQADESQTDELPTNEQIMP